MTIIFKLFYYTISRVQLFGNRSWKLYDRRFMDANNSVRKLLTLKELECRFAKTLTFFRKFTKIKTEQYWVLI